MILWFQSDNSNLPSQHKCLSLVFNVDLPLHSRPSPNALSFINLSILFPRLFCLHISIGMERKWGVEEEGVRGRWERGGMKNTRRSARETFLSFTPCVTVRYSFPLRFLSLPPALCFSSPSLSVRTGWGSPGRIKSTGSRLYLGSIPPNWFPKLWTVQSAAVVTWELSVVVLSRQSRLKMSMFDFWAWFCDWTKGTILFIKLNLDRDLLTSCEISSQAWTGCKAAATRPGNRAVICTPGKCLFILLFNLCHTIINTLFNTNGKNRDSPLSSLSYYSSLSVSMFTPGLYCVSTKPEVII